MVELHVYGFKGISQDLLLSLTVTITARFSKFFSPIKMHPIRLPVPFDAYDSARQQYRASPFLRVVSTQVSSKACGLGIVNQDLYTRDLNFIFGVAEKGGNAVVAIPRLCQSTDENPADEDLVFTRIKKVSFHELGHVLGLGHCNNHCVMVFSNCLEDTDQKPDTFCPSCEAKLAALSG
ncbi:MAG: archaemetzincin family Zn-dependent metalloprotease [Promethearchaeota archaeon]